MIGVGRWSLRALVAPLALVVALGWQDGAAATMGVGGPGATFAPPTAPAPSAGAAPANDAAAAPPVAGRLQAGAPLDPIAIPSSATSGPSPFLWVLVGGGLITVLLAAGVMWLRWEDRA